MYAGMHGCTQLRTYVCMYVCMHAFGMYVRTKYLGKYVPMYEFMYVRRYVCMYYVRI